MNKVELLGRLTKNPEIRYGEGENQVAVGRYTLAVNRRWKKEGDAEADFIPCVTFGKSATFAEKYFSKGQLICIVGRLQVRNWTDKDGNKRRNMEWSWRNSISQEVKMSIRSRGENHHRMGFIP